MNRPVILMQLAQGTRDLHARIECRVPLLDPDLRLDGYCDFLAAMLGFYEPFEDVLGAFPWQRAGLCFERRRKAGLAARDLRTLGLLDDRALARIPRCRELPRPADLQQAAGCLYVLEGATLGGHVLTRHVRRTLGLSPASECAFLACYGNAVGAMWRAFAAALACIVPDTSARNAAISARVVAAARDTFATLEGWLVHSLRHPSGPCPPTPVPSSHEHRSPT